MYLLKLALRPWRLSPMSQAFSAFAVGCLILMGGFLLWIQNGLKEVVVNLEGEQVITAYLEPTIESKDANRLANTIRDTIRLDLGAKNVEVRFIDAPDVLNSLKGSYPELSRELNDLGAETNSMVPRYISVAGLLPATTLSQIKALPGVNATETSRDRYRQIVGAFAALQWVARLLCLGLLVALMTGLIHLARTNAALQFEALGLLRLWGAGEWTLRLPGMLCGILVGALGGLIALVAWIEGGAWLAGSVRALSPALRTFPEPGVGFGILLFAVALMSGLLSGVALFAAIPGGKARL